MHLRRLRYRTGVLKEGSWKRSQSPKLNARCWKQTYIADISSTCACNVLQNLKNELQFFQVKNCSKLPFSFRERLSLKIFLLLLDSKKDAEMRYGYFR